MALTDILKDIANAIRAKNGEETQYKPSEMAAAIGAISGGGADFSEVERKLSNGFTDYSYYFYNRNAMTEVPSEILQHTASGTKFNNMFSSCKGITISPIFDLSNAEDCSKLYYGCSNLITAQVKNAPKVATYYQAFMDCSNLLTLEVDTSGATNLSNMFTNCNKLETVSFTDTSKVKNFAGIFNACSKLMSAELDFSSAENIGDYAFHNCSSLKNLTATGSIKVGFRLTYAPNLTHDSVMSVVNALYDYAAEGSTDTYKLTLGSSNLAKLTDAEKAIATEKGWTLA